MQSSRTQVIFRYLPGSVFVHEDGFVARSYRVDGNRIDSKVNKRVFLTELERELRRWPSDRIRGIPVPSTVGDEEFRLIEPTRVDWEVWPLLYACTNQACRRTRKFFRHDQAADSADPDKGLVCSHCESRLTQIRYFSAHACGEIQPMYTPKCKHCNRYDGVYLEDTGSFETAAWRCRDCGDAYIQGTRFTPCSCGNYTKAGKNVAFMRAFPVRDHRTFYPQTFSLINLESRVYDQLQRHPDRVVVSVASYLGDEANIQYALNELESGGGSSERMSQDQWREYEQKLREQMMLSEEDIAAIRDRRGPVDVGISGMRSLPNPVLELGEQRPMLERAILFDSNIVDDRRTLEDARREDQQLNRRSAVAAIEAAQSKATGLGIDEVSVTLQFPILLAAYGYTRTRKEPGTSHLHGFARQKQYDGKTPIFAAASQTEAILVTLSARKVLDWLAARGELADAPDSERDARLRVLELFVDDDSAAGTTKSLVHSFAHAMLRSLDDGQTGFGESSLAEWIVPETLTFGIYVSSFQSYTLGALWTLLHTRTGTWLDRTESSVWSCENDPLCHLREPRACERCMYLTFGCRNFNSNLSRSLLMDFWRHTTGTAASRPLTVATGA